MRCGGTSGRSPLIGAALVGAALCNQHVSPRSPGVHSSGPRWLVRRASSAAGPGRDRVSIHRGRVGWCGQIDYYVSAWRVTCPFIGAALVGAASTRPSWQAKSRRVHSSGPRWLVRPSPVSRTGLGLRCPFIGAALVGAAAVALCMLVFRSGVHSSGPRWLVRRRRARASFRSRACVHSSGPRWLVRQTVESC